MSYLPDKVLLATDGSEDGIRACRTAAELSQRIGAELHVVHVGLQWYLLVHDYMSPDQYERLKAERQSVLDAQVEEIEADLIVVGSRGMGTFSRALLGSDSNSIVHHANCPVFVVRGEAEN